MKEQFAIGLRNNKVHGKQIALSLSIWQKNSEPKTQIEEALTSENNNLAGAKANSREFIFHFLDTGFLP